MIEHPQYPNTAHLKDQYSSPLEQQQQDELNFLTIYMARIENGMQSGRITQETGNMLQEHLMKQAKFAQSVTEP